MPQLHTWKPLSMCRQNSVRDRPENSLHQKRTHAEWFSQSKCLELLPHVGIERNLDVMRRKIEESEKAGSRRESNPGHPACAARKCHILHISPPVLCTKPKVAKEGGGGVFAGHYGMCYSLCMMTTINHC